ncbi:hypothetical protein [Chitinimonas viridis]
MEGQWARGRMDGSGQAKWPNGLPYGLL